MIALDRCVFRSVSRSVRSVQRSVLGRGGLVPFRCCGRAATAGVLGSVLLLLLGPKHDLVGQVRVDSSGVQVVTNPPASTFPLVGSVDHGPVLVVGDEERGPGHEFSTVMDVGRQSDGQLVVAEHPSQELRVFSATGDLLFVRGGRGEGPGEFRDIRFLDVGDGDTIRAFDAGQQRISVFTKDGSFVRVVQLPVDDGLVGNMTLLPDGRWAGMGPGGLSPGAPGTISRRAVPFFVLSQDLRSRTFLVEAPGPMTAHFTAPDGAQGSRGAPFTPVPRYAVSGLCILVAFGDRPQVDVYESTGDLRAIIRDEARSEPVTEAHRENWSQALLEEVPEAARQQVRQLLASVPFPDELPTLNNLVMDSSGYLWVERYDPPMGTGGNWRVYDPSGELVGRVAVPPGIYIYRIGEDYIVGGWKEALGIEKVGYFKLERRWEPAEVSSPMCSSR